MTEFQEKLLLIVFDKGLITIIGGGLLLFGSWLLNRSLEQDRYRNALLLEASKARIQFGWKLRDRLSDLGAAGRGVMEQAEKALRKTGRVLAVGGSPPDWSQGDYGIAKERLLTTKQAVTEVLEANRSVLREFAGGEVDESQQRAPESWTTTCGDSVPKLLPRDDRWPHPALRAERCRNPQAHPDRPRVIAAAR